LKNLGNGMRANPCYTRTYGKIAREMHFALAYARSVCYTLRVDQGSRQAQIGRKPKANGAQKQTGTNVKSIGAIPTQLDGC